MTGCTAFLVARRFHAEAAQTGPAGASRPAQGELPLAGGGFGRGWYGLPLSRAAAANDAAAPGPERVEARRRHG